MTGSAIPVLASIVEAVLFAIAGIANLTAPAWVRRAYDEFDIRPSLYRTIGGLEMILAAAFATSWPAIWAILLAGAILLGAGVLLLDHRRYGFAAVVAGMIVLLFLAASGVAARHHSISYAALLPSHSTLSQLAVPEGGRHV